MKDALYSELCTYCQTVDGEIDTDMFRTVLAEVSRFEGKDRKGNPKTYEISDLFAENVSERWAGSALKKLREKLNTGAGNGGNSNG